MPSGKVKGRLPRCWDALGTASLPFGRDSSFCPSWPAYHDRPVTPAYIPKLVDLVRHLVAPHDAAGGVREGRLTSLMRLSCMQRFCLHVQILSGHLHVVAPESARCGTTPTSNCSRAYRKRLQGLAMTGAGPVGKYSADWSPTSLQWHFVAGLNVSECSGAIRPGDVNGPFTRIRMLTALRLLEEAARHGALGDTELIICAGEAPLNAGGWCLPSSAQPVFGPTGNEAAPVLPFPHWLPRLRDVDFSTWDESRRAMRDTMQGRSTYDERSSLGPAPVAAFRGGLYRLSAYSDDWRRSGLRRTLISADNWRTVGRLALLHAKSEPSTAPLLNVNMAIPDVYASALGISNASRALMDAPAGLSLAAQSARFAYVINAEGHGGWADRLARLLLSPQLVIAQDLAARLWFEGLLRAGATHLSVDSNFRNLSAVIRWARQHDAEVRRMVASANEVMEAVTSVGGIRFFVRELLQQYTARLVRYRPRRAKRAIRFECPSHGEAAQCQAPGESSPRRLDGVRCAFVAADGSGRRYSTLHDASQTIPGEHHSDVDGPGSAQAELCRGPHGPLDVQRDTKPQKQTWCYQVSGGPGECRKHSIIKGGQRCSCVWHEDLLRFASQIEERCPQLSRTTSSAQGCVAACCPGLCNA